MLTRTQAPRPTRTSAHPATPTPSHWVFDSCSRSRSIARPIVLAGYIEAITATIESKPDLTATKYARFAIRIVAHAPRVQRFPDDDARSALSRSRSTNAAMMSAGTVSAREPSRVHHPLSDPAMSRATYHNPKSTPETMTKVTCRRGIVTSARRDDKAPLTRTTDDNASRMPSIAMTPGRSPNAMPTMTGTTAESTPATGEATPVSYTHLRAHET